MTCRLKIPIPIHKNLFSALQAQGYGKKIRKENSAAEKFRKRDLQPDLNLKMKLDRVFDLNKGGDAMK